MSEPLGLFATKSRALDAADGDNTGSDRRSSGENGRPSAGDKARLLAASDGQAAGVVTQSRGALTFLLHTGTAAMKRTEDQFGAQISQMAGDKSMSEKELKDSLLVSVRNDLSKNGMLELSSPSSGETLGMFFGSIRLK